MRISCKSYEEDSNIGSFLEIDFQHPKKLHDLHNALPFLPDRTQIGMVEKFIANLYDKKVYIIHRRNLKQTLNNGLELKKVRKVIKLNKKAWLKSYTDMNLDLRKKDKDWFCKAFFQLDKQCSFWKNYGKI